MTLKVYTLDVVGEFGRSEAYLIILGNMSDTLL